MASNQSILSEINSTNYSNLLEIYKPSVGYSGFITALGLTVNLKSIDTATFPYLPDDTPPDVLEQILNDVATNTQFKELRILLKKGTGNWIERATIRLFNKEPYYEVDLMPYFSNANTIDVAEDLSFGLQIKTGNTLTVVDKIIVFGTVVEEKKNNGNEELASRISALETLLSIYGAPSASLPGSNGLVPAPPAGGGEFLLRGDRAWQNPNEFATPAQITAFASTMTNALAQKVGTIGNEIIAGLKTFADAVRITNTTQSTSTTTGAHIIAGGAAVGGNLNVGGFSSLGGNVAKKEKLFTGTTDSAGTANFAHGLTSSKIVGIQILVGGFAPVYLTPNFGGSAEYNYFFTAGTFYIVAGTNKSSIISVGYSVLISYIA